MIQRTQGFSLLELIMVIAIVGILAALGFGRLPKDRIEVQQAARSYVSSVQKARFEAISRNEFVGIRASGSGFDIFLDEDRSGKFTPGDTVLTSFVTGSSEYPSVALSVVAGSGEIVFDPRGVAYETVASSLRFGSSRDNSFALSATISVQGRVKVDKL